eukprot:1571115-Pyramimonas_sp.AAC.1
MHVPYCERALLQTLLGVAVAEPGVPEDRSVFRHQENITNCDHSPRTPPRCRGGRTRCPRARRGWGPRWGEATPYTTFAAAPTCRAR